MSAARVETLAAALLRAWDDNTLVPRPARGAMTATTPHWRIAAGDLVTTGTITDARPLQPGQRWHTTLSEPRLSPLRLTTGD